MAETPSHHACVPRGLRALGCALVAIAAVPASPRAQAFHGSAGYDYYSGPLGQITRTFEGFAGARIGPGSASATVSRFDDSLVGSGYGLGGGLAVPVAPTAWFRVWATTYRGDSGFSGRRLRAGPQLRLATGQTLALYAAHYEDTVLGTSNSVNLAFGAPMNGAIGGRASAGLASGIGVQGVQASVGMSWTVLEHIELSGDVGMARGAPIVSSASGKKGPETTTSSPPQGMVDVGVRVLFP